MKRRREKVKGHYRKDRKGKKVRVGGYGRKTKPMRQSGIHKAFKRKFEVTYYQDDQGRLVSRRRYKKLR